MKITHTLNKAILDNHKTVRVSSNELDIKGQVLSTDAAIKLANDNEMDLILVSDKATPCICIIQEYTKYIYEQKKKAKENKSNVQKIKEIQLSYNIGINDINVKRKNAESFLKDGDKVKCIIKLKGREMKFKDKAQEVLLQFITSLESHSKCEYVPKMEGNKYHTILIPKK